jgi:hypothetical protein
MKMVSNSFMAWVGVGFVIALMVDDLMLINAPFEISVPIITIIVGILLTYLEHLLTGFKTQRGEFPLKRNEKKIFIFSTVLIIFVVLLEYFEAINLLVQDHRIFFLFFGQMIIFMIYLRIVRFI